MYETVIVPENIRHGKKAKEINSSPPTKMVVFHNSSTEHTTVTAINGKTGRAVEVMLRKDAIPSWVNKPEK